MSRCTSRTSVLVPSGCNEISTVLEPGVIGLPSCSHPNVKATFSFGITSRYSPDDWFFPPTSTR